MSAPIWSRATCVGLLIGTLPGLQVHADKARSEGVIANICLSIDAPEGGISVAGIFRLAGSEILDAPGAGREWPYDADVRTRPLEQGFALDWFSDIISDVFT
jgi:sulfide dehydrogenase [flavocytochrome c] flavoprotein subunit